VDQCVTDDADIKELVCRIISDLKVSEYPTLSLFVWYKLDKFVSYFGFEFPKGKDPRARRHYVAVYFRKAGYPARLIALKSGKCKSFKRKNYHDVHFDHTTAAGCPVQSK
jgi:hypothetical protein